jgi:hypothetical protein
LGHHKGRNKVGNELEERRKWDKELCKFRERQGYRRKTVTIERANKSKEIEYRMQERAT